MTLIHDGFAARAHQGERDRFLGLAGQFPPEARNLSQGWVGSQDVRLLFPASGSTTFPPVRAETLAAQWPAAIAAWTAEGLCIAFEPNDSPLAVPLCTQAIAENLANAGLKADVRVVEVLIQRLEDAVEDASVRGWVASVLGKLDDADALGPLLRRLADAHEDPKVRERVAEALGNLGDSRAVEPLIQRVEDAEENDAFRCSVAIALSKLRDGRAVKPLIRQMGHADDNGAFRGCVMDALAEFCDALAYPLVMADPGNRYVAAERLAYSGDPYAVELLITGLADQDAGFRFWVAELLGNSGDANTVEPLIAVLEDEDPDVRERAALALGRLGDSRAVEPLIRRLTVDEVNVREAVITALVQIGDASAVEMLIRRLENADADAITRKWVTKALGKLGDARALGPLTRRLTAEDDDYRADVAEALGWLGDPRAVEALIALLEDQGGEVRFSAAIALGDIGDPRAVEPLLRCKQDVDEHPWVRTAAAVALAKLGDARAIEPLFGRPDDALQVYAQVGHLLAEHCDARTVGPLISRLTDDDADVRSVAVWVLGELGDPRAVEPLIACLGDGDAAVRRNVASALGELGNPLAVVPLIARLGDGDTAVRRNVASALGKLSDPRAAEPLLKRLEDANEDPEVRWAATTALSKLGDGRAAKALVENLLKHPQEAAAALGHLGFSPLVITAAFIDAHYRELLPALATAPAYHPNLLRLVHAAGAHATTAIRNFLVRQIWDWRETRAPGITLAQLESDFAALAAETDNPHGPAADNPVVHLYLARLLLADPAALAERVAAADRHLASAWEHSREDETVLRLVITWLRAEAAMRLDDPRRAYMELQAAQPLVDALRLPELGLCLPWASYTAALAAYAADRLGANANCPNEEQGRTRKRRCTRAAVELLYQVEDRLAEEKKKEWIDEATATEVAIIHAGFAILVQQHERDWHLSQAGQLPQEAGNLPLGWVGHQAKRQLEQGIAQ